MRVIYHSATASHLALSRTNLLTLLAALDHGVPEISRTITKGVDGVFLAVTSEHDEEHYAAQGQDGPGPAADVLATHKEASCD